MVTSPTLLLRHFRATRTAQAGPTDGLLLRQFAAHRDQAAFEELLGRHGPMVFGVCRRVLGNSHDAEDAFQATFLVLARKAGAVAGRDSVGNWLYGVARRTALSARRSAARRRVRESQAVPRAAPDDGRPAWSASDTQVLAELRADLDRELARLPEKYRAVLVACELEGLARREAADRLGWKEGTVASRLARAKSLLGRRLARHGLAPEAAAVTVPVSLFVATVQAVTGTPTGRAAALSERMIRTMLVTQTRTATAVLLAAGLAIGGGLALRPTANAGCGPLAYQPVDPDALQAPEKGPQPPVKEDPPAKTPPRSGGGQEGFTAHGANGFSFTYGLFTQQTASGKAKLDLPSGPPPYQVIACVDEDGELVVQTKAMAYRTGE